MAEPAELSPDGAPVMPPSSPAVPSVNTLSFHVMTQAFWPELQRLISGADWTQFPRNADMLEYLTSSPVPFADFGAIVFRSCMAIFVRHTQTRCRAVLPKVRKLSVLIADHVTVQPVPKTLQ